MSPKPRIGWSWGSKDGWLLHRTTKDELWKIINTGKFNFRSLVAILNVKSDWIEMHDGDAIVINYPLLLAIWKHYLTVYKKFNPPVIYRLGINKVGIIFLTLYREDSAYTERFGGFIQYIIDHRKEWIGDKAKRLEFLRNLRNWWYVEDWRSRGKDELARFFDWAIDLYDTEPFVTESIDYFIDNLLLNSGSWDRVLDPKGVSYFSPAKWYPRGKGTINYLCHNRKS